MCPIIFSCDQAALQMVFVVCPSVCHRARRLFFPQLGSRTTIKPHRLVRNRNQLGHDYKKKFVMQKLKKILENFYHMYLYHYGDVIMSAMASQITSASIVHSAVCSGADQRKLQNSALPVTRIMFPFDDVITILISRFTVTEPSCHTSNHRCSSLGVVLFISFHFDITGIHFKGYKMYETYKS